MSDFDAWVPEDGSPDVAESHAGPDEARAGRSSQLRRWGMPVGLLGAGALIGGVVAASLSASAAPNPSPSPAAPAAPGAPGFGHGMPAPGQPGPGCRGPGFPGRGFHGLDHTGTVTAVGTNSVTIKESSGTTTYAVTSKSDIDKNGEAKLSDLKAGDAVRFGVVTISGKKTIAVLHAGNEALNRPRHGPGGRDHPGPPPPSPGTSGSSSNSASYTA